MAYVRRERVAGGELDCLFSKNRSREKTSMDVLSSIFSTNEGAETALPKQGPAEKSRIYLIRECGPTFDSF
jgi:hypothetical protein